MQRKTIAIDIDDVLSANAEGFAEFSNQRWNANITADDYQENWLKVWNVPLEEALKRREELHASGVMGTYRHDEAALPVLKRLTKRYRLVIVTSRRSDVKPETDRWLDRHFPNIFEGIHYAGIWDNAHPLQAVKMHKAELCRELGADYLIDDQLKHCLGAADGGITALLFGRYNWNKTKKSLPKNVIRVKDWHEVEEYFDAQS